MKPPAKPPSRTNVVLIGMPGSGKSTVGVVLAKRLGLGFVDTDLIIQSRAGRTLQQILDSDGVTALRDIEAEAVTSFQPDRQVVATGGSVVYSDAAMRHLRGAGTLVWLEVDLATLERRVGDYSQRGIAKQPRQSFEEVFSERTQLYQQWAEIVVDAAGPTTEAVCERIQAALASVVPTSTTDP
ncbi:MAG: shikimate kinase [Planctomycetota bacterium]